MRGLIIGALLAVVVTRGEVDPVVVVGAALAVYAFDVVLFPVGRHWRCSGTGWHRSWLSGGMRPCSCDGGKHVRWAWFRRGGDD